MAAWLQRAPHLWNRQGLVCTLSRTASKLWHLGCWLTQQCSCCCRRRSAPRSSGGSGTCRPQGHASRCAGAVGEDVQAAGRSREREQRRRWVEARRCGLGDGCGLHQRTRALQPRVACLESPCIHRQGTWAVLRCAASAIAPAAAPAQHKDLSGPTPAHATAPPRKQGPAMCCAVLRRACSSARRRAAT